MAKQSKDTINKAVALEYDGEQDSAPKVTAAGRGRVAEEILAIAFAQGIKVREDADLVEQAIQNVLNSGIRTADIMQDGMARVSSTVMMDSIMKELNKLIGV